MSIPHSQQTQLIENNAMTPIGPYNENDTLLASVNFHVMEFFCTAGHIFMKNATDNNIKIYVSVEESCKRFN
jgi:hypothetical protein